MFGFSSRKASENCAIAGDHSQFMILDEIVICVTIVSRGD